MLVHTPNTLKGTKGNVAIIEVHSGGCIGGSIDQNKPIGCLMAIKSNAIVFNCKYRLAGSGASGMQMTSDVVACIKHVKDNAMTYCVDPNKIVLHGCSGGGYVVASTCSRLTLTNEGHLLKLAIMNCSSDPGYYLLTKKEDMPFMQVRDASFCTPFIAEAYSTDFDK